jgi:hypothetical protein
MLMRAFGAKIEGFEDSRLAALHASIEQAFEPYRNGDRYELLSTDMVAHGVA